MKYLIDIPPKLVEKAKDAIIKGQYESLDQFILIAIENQTKAELDHSNPWEAFPKTLLEQDFTSAPSILDSTVFNSDIIKRPSGIVPTTEYAKKDMLNNGPLWGQYYRFFPAKVAVRVLANMSKNAFVEYNQFRNTGASVAATLGKKLKKYDKIKSRKIGDALFTGFPNDNEKSKERFMNEYLVYLASDHKSMRSLPSELNLLNVIIEGGSVMVGLTPTGRQFCDIQNPFLDNNIAEPLSDEEKKFILDNIFKYLPAEAIHMKLALQEIASGITSRTGLDERMGLLYVQYWGKLHNWSRKVIDTMRAGVTSRLFELGLITKQKKDREVTYKLSKYGEDWLSKIDQHDIVEDNQLGSY